MKRYRCRVSDSGGKISEVLKASNDEKTLIRQIGDEGLYLISFREETGRVKKKFTPSLILDFTDTMALMLRSGLTIRDALKVASASFRDKKAAQLIETLTGSLNKGISFPDALETMSADFSPLYRGMVRIGDRSGSMEHIFSKLSSYLNDEKTMRDKIRGALIYPVLVLSVLFLGMLAVFFFIFPRLKNSFADQSLDVVFQRFQLIMSLFLIPLTLLILALLFLFIASHSRGDLKKKADFLWLKIPLAGNISLLRSALNVFFSLEVLTSSGFPIESAIKESANVLGNTVLREALERIGQAIVKGDSLSRAFGRERIYPERIPLWISVGEASGDVGAVFSQLRNYYQGELDRITSRIMLLVEPVLIVLVGLFMILFVILFVVPLFGVFGGAL